MIPILEDILTALQDLGIYFLSALVEFLNKIFEGMGAIVTVLFELLPKMPLAEEVHIEGIAWLNWFYPVGTVVAVLVSGLALYVGWLAVRYLLQLLSAS